jgi:hypothetical protein
MQLTTVNNVLIFYIRLRIFRDRYGESFATSELVSNEFIGRATHLIKALNRAKEEGLHLGEIQHFNHLQHKLILCDGEIKDDKLCQGCIEFIISVLFYSCAQCNFFLHTQCTKLPNRIEQHQLHDFHTLTLLFRAITENGVFYCEFSFLSFFNFFSLCWWLQKETVIPSSRKVRIHNLKLSHTNNKSFCSLQS